MDRNRPHFFKIRLELARETHSPSGDARTGYEFVAPLDDEGRIWGDLWEDEPASCMVRFFTPGQQDRKGMLERDENGEWYFDYDESRSSDDEHGYRFGDERFIIGEYVSIADAGDQMHTYRVTQVEKP
ncbi:hypothetical protein [Pelagibacterium limicola]|uniref:hypothetical protein n=1 Tax=Pelagibacterium limicola TaxID=2791022 RepID=UPI0018AFC528|nr:hypothetical protein [Pelagibacterium limicola]